LTFFDLTEWYCQYQGTGSGTGNYQSVWLQTHYDDVTDENNNIRFKCPDIHYHYYQTRYDTSDNVCLDLQNWCYSIYIATKNIYNFKDSTSWAESVEFYCKWSSLKQMYQ
jgi:hypothetical protein